ncbi:MAG: hypothetical protein WCV90_00520 [Candidatus Woesearchaeota archaeon]|jgi:hypothetical protein
MATEDILYVGVMVPKDRAYTAFGVSSDKELGDLSSRKRQGLDVWTSWHDQIVIGRILAQSGTSHGSLVSCYNWDLTQVKAVIDDVEPRIRKLGLEDKVNLRYESSVRIS